MVAPHIRVRTAGGIRMKQHFEMFAAYNRWANQRLYDAAAALSKQELDRNMGAFFKSMLGTLNHVLAGDRIWMKAPNVPSAIGTGMK